MTSKLHQAQLSNSFNLIKFFVHHSISPLSLLTINQCQLISIILFKKSFLFFVYFSSNLAKAFIAFLSNKKDKIRMHFYVNRQFYPGTIKAAIKITFVNSEKSWETGFYTVKFHPIETIIKQEE
ncbi:hypothetical protein BpHYR1_044654 [Brachionus plicatilis]|uniref:Uncharacterized protein n=1 Tax=Brachionus plicatilis TaxID=10195 RepID=A0A3M7T658_BRAPC|nr:hypothetical protein BpHYR1_044654 [Brachionus plicatilis]